MSSRCVRVKASGITTTPPFGSAPGLPRPLDLGHIANPGSLNSTANDGAAASIRRQYCRNAVSRLNTGSARVTGGAISLSNSSHLPPIAGSKLVKPSQVAAGMRKARDEPAADRIANLHEHDRHGGSLLPQCRRRRRTFGHDDVRRRADQLFCVNPHKARVSGAPADSRSLGLGPPTIQACRAPAGTPRRAEAFPGRFQRAPTARRCAALDRVAAPLPPAATLPPRPRAA